MYLKRLEISGFKSFANKTVLDFPHQITAIVGPNGSGKSNAADAIKWALGEQSLKSLRGKKSEDIIFSGSNKKAKMSVASVSLVFANQNREINVDTNEVKITRKIFRDGESEYLINTQKSKLLDIITLLADAGISQKGYCVINQGMADAILMATPQERVAIFEEATGVRKFQIKKEQALKKLNNTQKNLFRVKELLLEIEPRLNLLQKQTQKAQKREELTNELQNIQHLYYQCKWTVLFNKNSKSQQDLQKLQQQIATQHQTLLNIKQNLESNHTDNQSYDHQLKTLQQQITQLQPQINELQKNIAVLEGRIELEQEKISQAKKPEFMLVNLGYVKNKISNILNIYKNIHDNITNISQLPNFNTLQSDSNNFLQELKVLLTEVEAGKVNVQKESTVDNSKLLSYQQKKQELVTELTQINQKYQEINHQITSLGATEQQKRQTFFQLEKEYRSHQETLNRLKDNLNNTNIEVAKFEIRKEDILTEIQENLGTHNELLPNIQKNLPFADQTLNINQVYELEQQIKKIKYQLEQIGSIDPLVLEEYQETQERFDFLSYQVKDLEEASVSLNKIIKELDQKTTKIFKTSFDNINKEFNRYFQIIFGGGNATLSFTSQRYTASSESTEELTLSEESTEYDTEHKITGIQITATPPNKKITNLNMLSGGERALTSIAVLFAIIANNPPPFSVLDEIDAALDEANSSRLSQIIKEVAKNIQFVIITHNREMMQQANVLYGVTMQDDGTSKIISLNLDNWQS